MASTNSSQFPVPFPESNPTHLLRLAEVVILKRLRNYELPGLGQSETEYQAFQREFYEFLGRGGLLSNSKALDSKWANPDDTSTPLYKHFYVLATASQNSSSANSVAGSLHGNDDVISARATVNTEGRGSCVIELACPQDKYLFKKNLFRQGQSVIEPNDFVYVNLPGMDRSMYRVFTGLVSKVTVEKLVGDTIQTRVILECEDNLKPLTQSRTAIKPSLTPEMADGGVFSGLENDFSGMLPHSIMAQVLGLAYSDPFTVAGYYDKLNTIRQGASNGTTGAAAAATQEAQLNKSLVTFQTPSPSGPAYIASSPFIVTGVAAPSVDSALVAEPTTLNTQSAQNSAPIPSKLYGFRRCRTELQTASTAIDLAINPFAPLDVADMDDLSFVISGTTQPAFQLAFSSSASLYFADFKSGLSICKQIADDLNYEFYANHNGVVLFRPLNTALPYNFSPNTTPKTTSRLQASGQVGVEYWLDDRFISNPQFVDSDADIYTFAYVGADLQITTGGVQYYKGMAFDLQKYLKFGARTAPLVTKLNLNSDAVCQQYAESYLNRLNSLYYSGSLQYTGDARLQAGNPCYVKSRNMIFYIASITHTFVAGQSYTMNLNLKYGRRPIAASPTLLASVGTLTDVGWQNVILNRGLNNVIASLVDGGATQVADYITNNTDELTFQNYVWEPLLALDYETLYADIVEQRAFNITKEIVENYNFGTKAYTTKYVATQQANPLLSGQFLVNSVAQGLCTSQGVSA